VKAVLDACVLVPPVVRDCLLSAAATGAYAPLWSERILTEWARAAAKHGRDDGPVIAAAHDQFARAIVAPAPGIEARLHLPDEGDIHVLATAVAGSADTIVTWNTADFPRATLAAEGVARRDPDGFLWELWSRDPDGVGAALERVRAKAEVMAGAAVGLRPLLKRAGLTRLARAVG
jgi:predicted nucleic acid-binding protein